MVRDQLNARNSSVHSPSEVLLASVENDSDIEIELIELVKALARAAAREDYRKAKNAETIPITEAGRE
jgi:hypothetical protein